jgi:AcrR family transcriptional regulator
VLQGTAQRDDFRATPTRRDAILAAAARMFAENGYRGVGMDDIGEAVGVTGPALYRHFAGKDAILATLLVDVSERLLQGGRDRARAAAGAELLGELVHWQVDFALGNPELILIQERDLDALPSSDRRSVRRLQRGYVEIWVDALRQHSPGLGESTARTAVQAAIGLINSTPHSVGLRRPDAVAVLLGRMALAALHAA